MILLLHLAKEILTKEETLSILSPEEAESKPAKWVGNPIEL